MHRDPLLPPRHSITSHSFNTDEIATLRSCLLTWFDTCRRLLAWRGDTAPYAPSSNPPGPTSAHDPYAIWVSEIMLQQTRVETVIPYYENWMRQFPSIESLAEATIDDVNKAWAGLGYYRRAKYLLDGAKFVMKEFNGKLPDHVQELKRVPGIGEYTAGAIASIAFDRPAPVVDGNVIRVFSRLRAIAAAPNDPKAIKLHWKLAADCVDTQRPGDFNQALMELGATVCTQWSAQCDICPVQSICLAYRENDTSRSVLSDIEDCCDVCADESEIVIPIGDVLRYPLAKIKTKQRQESTKICCLETEQGFLLIKRADKGLLAGQWEFPCWERHESQLSRILSSSPSKPISVGSINHIFSHIRLAIDIQYLFVASIPKRHFAKFKTQFMPRAAFGESPLTTGVQKVFRAIHQLSKSV